MNPYITKFDMKNGTINICGGDTRFSILIDEWPEIQEKAQAEYERAKAIMGNPLLDTRGVDESIAYYAKAGHLLSANSLKPMIEFYQNTLVMLRELESSLHNTANAISAYDDEGKLGHEYVALINWEGKIAAILEAHKHNMPAIVEGE